MRPQFNQTEFFDGLVEDLRVNGVFASYDEPLGERSTSNLKLFTKLTHSTDRKKNLPGLVTHLGDQPYDLIVRGEAAKMPNSRYINPTQEQINLKSDSIRKAIKAYMPPAGFARYVQFFAENLDAPEHRQALDTAFENMQSQFTGIRNNIRLSGHKFPASDLPEATGHKARFILSSNSFYEKSKDQPELVLAFAVFQAAHIGYLQQMQQAVGRSGKLTADEQENAEAVFHGALRQFDHFLLFSSLLPLTLINRESIAANAPEGTSNKDINLAAIDAGWKDFDKKRVLTATDMSREEMGYGEHEKGAVKVVCPAKQHLRETQNNGLLPILYDMIETHKGSLQDVLKYAGEKIDLALTQDRRRDMEQPWLERVRRNGQSTNIYIPL